MSSFIKALWRGYESLLNRRPILAKALMVASMGAAGDAIAQGVERQLEVRDNLEKKRKIQPFKYDFARTTRIGLYGLCFSGPYMHFWFGALTKIVPAAARAAPLKQMILDQAVMAPIMLAAFLSGTGFMEGMTTTEVKRKLDDVFVPALKANYMVWPLAQYVNFRYIPLHHRPLFSMVLSLGWNTYICMVNAKGSKPVEDPIIHEGSTMIEQDPAQYRRTHRPSIDTSGRKSSSEQDHEHRHITDHSHRWQ
eukprot:TRINITY_DN8298_c0_g1_i1.p1 TRINITY_DN8298_c0_g1~~TRINITY_DN8298_c0_g1_i1.p1  ORF type:complete len:251 (+),score=36.47 TRINITY_DN8298_c0_g1_i1:150-902(+)